LGISFNQPVHRYRANQPANLTPDTDCVARETPVALEYNGISHATVLATPTDIEDLALGFSLTEGIIRHADDLYDVQIEQTGQGHIAHLTIASACMAQLKQRRRTLAGRTGCGLCGLESLDSVVQPLPPVAEPKQKIAPQAVMQGMHDLRERQPLHHKTGAVHAAAWADFSGMLHLVREDVGRHNALDKLIKLIDQLSACGIHIEHLDLGGGIGIRYVDETPLTPTQLLDAVFARLQAAGYPHLQIVLEPGRSLVGNAGALLTTVQYLKHNEAKHFAVVDAAMNDLLRPTLYEAWHAVEQVVAPAAGVPAYAYDIVGPICESGDWLARNRKLALRQGDLLAILSAGAYAFTMSSQYNTRPRPAEVMVDGSEAHLIRPRETLESLYAGELTLP